MLEQQKLDKEREYEEKQEQLTERMNQIVKMCKYDTVETEKSPLDGADVVKRIEKIDLSKFRTAFVSINVNEEIKAEIKENRAKKEQKAQEAMDSGMFRGKNRKKASLGGFGTDDRKAKL